MATSAKEALRVIKKYYCDLQTLLPISEVIDHLYSKGQLSDSRKLELDNFKSSRKEQIKYFLHNMLIPGLKSDFTRQFEEMLSFLKEYEDPLSKHLIKRMMGDLNSSISTVSSTSTSTTSLATEAGIK